MVASSLLGKGRGRLLEPQRDGYLIIMWQSGFRGGCPYSDATIILVGKPSRTQ